MTVRQLFRLSFCQVVFFVSVGYVFRKILTNGNHGFNISQHRKMHLTTPFWASRTATLTILDRKIVKVTGRNSQSGDAKQTVSQPKIGCFALKSQLFSSPEQWFWLKKSSQTADIQHYTQEYRKSANFRAPSLPRSYRRFSRRSSG